MAYTSQSAGQESMFPDVESEETGSETQDNQDSGETALIPKSITGGRDCKVGEQLVFRVNAIHDDQLEVSFVKYEEEPEGSEGSYEAPPESSSNSSEMDELMA